MIRNYVKNELIKKFLEPVISEDFNDLKVACSVIWVGEVLRQLGIWMLQSHMNSDEAISAVTDKIQEACQCDTDALVEMAIKAQIGSPFPSVEEGEPVLLIPSTEYRHAKSKGDDWLKNISKV